MCSCKKNYSHLPELDPRKTTITSTSGNITATQAKIPSITAKIIVFFREKGLKKEAQEYTDCTLKLPFYSRLSLV